MKIGIGSYTYGWESGTYGPHLTQDRPRLTAHELVGRAVALGAEVVQLCVRPDVLQLSSEELASLASHAHDNGIDIELGTIGSDPDHLLRQLDAARTLDARLLRTIFPDASEGLHTEEENLARVLPHFESAGVTIAVENHERYSFRELVALLERRKSPCLGVCLDSVNSLGRGEGIGEVFAALAPHTRNFHVKEFTVTRGDIDMGFSITGAPLGEGRLDVEAQVRELYRMRPHANLILEQWTPLASSIEETIAVQREWAREGVARLRSILQRVTGSE